MSATSGQPMSIHQVHRHVHRHVESQWPSNELEAFSWEEGPVRDVLPQFLVCCVRPQSPDEPWVYITSGASDVDIGSNYSNEFFLVAPSHHARHIQTLAMIAFYHSTNEGKLDVGRIVEMGRPWIDGSKCDHFLVSLPYLYGPKMEWYCEPSEKIHIRFLWLLPITQSEATFAKTFGVEALERRLEDGCIDGADPHRATVA